MLDINRFKNYGTLVAIFAFIPLILQSFGLNILPENYKEVVNSFLGILVLLGVVNDPTSGKGYSDKIEE